MRALLIVLLAGCAAAAPATDRGRLRAIMGRNDDHKLRIQYRTHAPDETIPERIAAIETNIRELAMLQPFGDERDKTVASMAARVLPALGELRAPWTVENREANWRKLEAICSGCHRAVERR